MQFNLTNTTVGTYTIFTGSSISGGFTSMLVGNTVLTSSLGDFSGADEFFNYSFTNNSNLLTIAAVPEPSTYALMILGAFLLVWRTFQRAARIRKSTTAASVDLV
jgi:hypothetical protein